MSGEVSEEINLDEGRRQGHARLFRRGSSTMPYALELRYGFSKAEITALAARCAFGDQDDLLNEIGLRSRAAGYYTRADFVRMCKSTNANKQCDANSDHYIERWTRISLSSASERDRIRSLMHLSGVSWLTASVLLHYSFENEYPILAQSALWSWGFDHKPELNLEFWRAYVQANRDLCSECRITMRTLDRALRQYAIEQAH
jgi:hypothetical protein